MKNVNVEDVTTEMILDSFRKEFVPRDEVEEKVLKITESALEKQISKKPIKVQSKCEWDNIEHESHICPCCKSELRRHVVCTPTKIKFETDKSFNFCNECGQRIDWSEEDGQH